MRPDRGEKDPEGLEDDEGSLRAASPQRPLREHALVRMALLFYAGVLALALGVSAVSGRSPVFASAEAAGEGVDWAGDALVGAVAAAAVVALSALLTSATRWGEALAQALAEILGPLSTRSCLLLALASGVAEEALFRGALQPLVGLSAASVLFGLAHLVPRRELLPWTGFTLLAGFGLGALYAWTGNLLAPVVAHFGVNAVNLRLLTSRANATR